MTVELDRKQIGMIRVLIQNCVDESVNWLQSTKSMEDRRTCNEALELCSGINRALEKAMEEGNT